VIDLKNKSSPHVNDSWKENVLIKVMVKLLLSMQWRHVGGVEV
jgi:hypothetical protein